MLNGDVWLSNLDNGSTIVRFSLDATPSPASIVYNIISVFEVNHAESGMLHGNGTGPCIFLETYDGTVAATPGFTLVDLMREPGFFQVMGTWTFELDGIQHVAISFAHATSLFQATVEVSIVCIT